MRFLEGKGSDRAKEGEERAAGRLKGGGMKRVGGGG